MTAREGFRRGEVVALTVEKNVYRGRGLGRVEGRVVLVPRAHEGDEVRASVREAHAGWAEASLVEVTRPSPTRRLPPCRYAERCGGCAYQEVEYEAQLRTKEAILRESLARAGAPLEAEVVVHGSPERGWRMRAGLHFEETAEGLRIGLRQEGTRRLVEIDECLQLSQGMNAAARALRDALGARAGLRRRLRGLDLLEAPGGDQRVACVRASVRPALAQELTSLGRQAGLSGFGVRGDEHTLTWLEGSPRVDVSVLGVGLRTHVESFFQANRFLIEPLARVVLGFVPSERGRILDLYSGVGLFALPLAARDGCEVVGVEGAPRAIEDARHNARRAGLGNAVRFVAGDVAASLDRVAPVPNERVVLDPPRTGLGRGVVEMVADRNPSVIVYVSCDPPTLGRDLARFLTRGYRVAAVEAFDMFPDTYHVETVVQLQR